jgi:nucleotidyltransferase substrate binding protein (TIGR01987 family)
MSAEKAALSLINLGRALERLSSVLSEPDHASEYIIDATIQRFEFSYELFWKTLKRLLAFEEISDASTPREAKKAAFQQGWLEDEAVWLQMRDDRNATSHLYSEEMAKQIYERIKFQHYPEMRRTYDFLKARFSTLLPKL